MSIEKREISLMEVLGVYLSYTPNYSETERFRSDLRTLNHTLLRDSILECTKSGKVDKPNRASKRQLMHSVYTRKVKELASMYPFLFTVENALRAVAAERYASVFKTPFWWKVFTRAYEEGRDEGEFPLDLKGKKNVHTVPVNPAFIKTVLSSVSEMPDRKRRALDTPETSASQFYETLTLRQLTDIISSDWSISSLGKLKKKDFERHVRAICEARNELFHGNPIKNRGTVFTACERILDSIDVHMGDLDEALKATSYVRPSASIPRVERHCIPPL